MREMWQNLTLREQKMLMLALPLVLLALVYLLIIRPMNDRLIMADLAHDAAAARYQRVLDLAARVNSQGTSKPAQTMAVTAGDTDMRSTLTNSALASGISISRLQPAGKRLSLWVDRVAAVDLFQWLDRLDVENGLSPVQLVIEKNDDGTSLSVQVSFLEAAS